MSALLGGVVLIGAPLTVLVFLAIPAETFALLIGQSALLVFVAGGVVAVLVLVRSRSGGGAVYPIDMHANGWSMSSTRRHENGHARVGRALGCTMRVVMNDNGRAYTRTVSGPPLTPAQHAAIAFGGEAAAGSGGCGTDRRIAESYLRRVPGRERGAARREAWRIARRYA